MPTYGYTGREPDATGLIHYRARYYHPELGRFVSRDPLGLAAGINPYAYADGNPVLFNDPDGLMAALAWNSASSYVSQNGTRLLDRTQTVLDVAGLVPGFGELADGANALIYLGRGDNTNAALSGAAMIPFIGWGATTAKVVGRVDNAVDTAIPSIKAGSAGGVTAGKAFPQAIKDAANAENPLKVCVFCVREGVATQVDHAIPKARGGNATLDNAQLACPHCNASKGARDFPVNPPPGYFGKWPPSQ